MTAVLYDLRTAASEGGARKNGGCSEDDLIGSLDSIITDLTKN